ncbi:hypothetical protein SERLA73DRAFT_69867 [Serpula lacrymans var. lacrymans S7.3]|uniref:Mid2 domain-containing protein n=1 Tax=Serpula lacrymans var. lacrymans (strain S7.3) TaxID=936435 RepID=F8PIY2_SERL3|nr:hypothetical protein SERLA73DRAFT_69867 [Serpula lacrymans var. lacrymans S7.3]
MAHPFYARSPQDIATVWTTTQIVLLPTPFIFTHLTVPEIPELQGQTSSESSQPSWSTGALLSTTASVSPPQSTGFPVLSTPSPSSILVPTNTIPFVTLHTSTMLSPPKSSHQTETPTLSISSMSSPITTMTRTASSSEMPSTSSQSLTSPSGSTALSPTQLGEDDALNSQGKPLVGNFSNGGYTMSSGPSPSAFSTTGSHPSSSSPSPPPALSAPGAHRSSLTGILVGSVIGGLVLVAILVFIIVRLRRKTSSTMKPYINHRSSILRNDGHAADKHYDLISDSPINSCALPYTLPDIPNTPPLSMLEIFQMRQRIESFNAPFYSSPEGRRG